MAGTDATDLLGLAEELLEASAAALDTIPGFDADLDGAPERMYVSPGEPAADCCDPGQLTVHTQLVSEAFTEPGGLDVGRRVVRSRINHVGLIVTVFRCVPVGEQSRSGVTPPTVEALEGASAQIYADAWALWNHLANRIRAGLLFSRCGSAAFEGVRVLLPSGGCGGVVASFRVSLDGYEEDLV